MTTKTILAVGKLGPWSLPADEWCATCRGRCRDEQECRQIQRENDEDDRRAERESLAEDWRR